METDVRSVIRALAVLRELNLNNGASILELHHATGISRPALYRIARTLQHAGYVTIDKESQSHRLTPLVKHLSAGFTDEDWISDVAGPVLDRLQKAVIWPTDLFSFFNDSMVMRSTTRRASPWVIETASVGFRIPLLITAVGRAYLAHLPQPEADGILDRLRRSDHPDDSTARDPRLIGKLLHKIRQQGYALREKCFMPQTGSVAVPVLDGTTVRGSIGITYISSALSTKDLVARLVPLLQGAAKEIGREIMSRKRAT